MNIWRGNAGRNTVYVFYGVLAPVLAWRRWHWKNVSSAKVCKNALPKL